MERKRDDTLIHLQLLMVRINWVDSDEDASLSKHRPNVCLQINIIDNYIILRVKMDDCEVVAR